MIDISASRVRGETDALSIVPLRPLIAHTAERLVKRGASVQGPSLDRLSGGGVMACIWGYTCPSLPAIRSAAYPAGKITARLLDNGVPLSAAYPAGR